MSENSRRVLNTKLHELYSFVPVTPEPDEKQQFEQYNRGVQLFTEEEATAIESFKVYVWSWGGPKHFNTDNGPVEDLLPIQGVCETGEHNCREALHICQKCGVHHCEEHGDFLMGEWFCTPCTRKFWS